MGIFRAKFILSNLAHPSKRRAIEGIVDTGAVFPFIPTPLLRSLDIRPTERRTFVLADGRKKKLSVGNAQVAHNGHSAPCLVVFAPRNAEPLFGALALESLGLQADPVHRKLRPTQLYLV